MKDYRGLKRIGQSQISLFPEPERFDLFLLIDPSEEVISDNKGFKQNLFNKIGHFDSFKSKPHISLETMTTTEELIQKNINSLIENLTDIPAFEICLKGLGVFQHGSNKTIYMNIMNPSSIINLFNRISLNKRSFNPHITIAKNITDDQFETIWPLFKDTFYIKKFLCDHISILIRPGDSSEPWKSLTKIALR